MANARSGIGYRNYISGGSGADVRIETTDRADIGYVDYVSGGIGADAVVQAIIGIGYGNYLSGGFGVDIKVAATSEMSSSRIDDTVLDGGLALLDTVATTIWICSQQPATYAETLTYGLGYKAFAAGAAYGSPTDYASGGRTVASTAFTDGEVTGTGTATHWAVTSGARLYAAGKLNAPLIVSPGLSFQLPSFKITLQDGGGIWGVDLGYDVLDGGLNALALANKIVICSAVPSNYATAVANTIGVKAFGIGHCFGTIIDYSDGREISSVAISDGTVTVNGTPACWAVLDDVNARLLATGNISGATAVEAGEKFALSSFTINLPGVIYLWQPTRGNLTLTSTAPELNAKADKTANPAQIDLALTSTAPTVIKSLFAAAIDLVTMAPSLEAVPAFSFTQGPLTIEELFGIDHLDQLLIFNGSLDPGTQKLMKGGVEVTYQVISDE